MTHGDGFDVEEEAHLQAVTADGTAVSLAASWRFHSPTDMHALEVLGSEGTARLSPLTIHKVVGGRTVDATPRQPVPRGGENHFTNGYRRLLDDFVRVVGGTARARALDDQVTLMRVIEGSLRIGARRARGALGVAPAARPAQDRTRLRETRRPVDGITPACGRLR